MDPPCRLASAWVQPASHVPIPPCPVGRRDHGVRVPAVRHVRVADEPAGVLDTDGVGGEVEARSLPVAHDVLKVDRGLTGVEGLRVDHEVEDGARVVGAQRSGGEAGGQLHGP